MSIALSSSTAGTNLPRPCLFQWSISNTETCRSICIGRFPSQKPKISHPNLSKGCDLCTEIDSRIATSSLLSVDHPPSFHSPFLTTSWQNVLVIEPGPDWWVKIGDFGISKRAENEATALRTVIGTEAYLAPEIIGFVVATDETEPDSAPFSYTVAVDMWALGELAFRLIAQRAAFRTRQDLFHYVVSGRAFPVEQLVGRNASSDCQDFISKAMAPAPNGRLTAREAMFHRWIQVSPPSSRSSSRESLW
jgi:hypothetical protein